MTDLKELEKEFIIGTTDESKETLNLLETKKQLEKELQNNYNIERRIKNLLIEINKRIFESRHFVKEV